MATVSALPLQRPKKLVRYGKASSRSNYSTKHVDSWLNDDDEEESLPLQKVERGEIVKQAYTARKPETMAAVMEARISPRGKATAAMGKSERVEGQQPVVSSKQAPKTQANRAVKPRAKKQDTFDVPSSEDDVEDDFVVKRVSPPKFKAKRTLVDDTKDPEEALAPWEQKRAEPGAIRRRRADVSSEAQMPVELPEDAKRHAKEKSEKSAVGPRSPGSGPETKHLSAAARLAARKQQIRPNTPSQWQATSAARTVVPSNKRVSDDARSSTPRKRARKSTTSDLEGGDVAMTDAPIELVCESQHHDLDAAATDSAVFDFPADDVEQAATPKSAMVARTRRTAAKAAAATTIETNVVEVPDRPAKAPKSKSAAARQKSEPKRPRRGRVASSTRSTPKKGLSAPARLTEMLPVDTDSTDAPSRSPSALPSDSSTPRRSATPANAGLTSTPPARKSGSPPAAGALTPKQAQLWSQLLPSDPPAPSPSSLAMKELTITGRRRAAAATTLRQATLVKSSSDVPELHRRRTRLVDRLRASAPSSDDESSEEESDVAMDDAVPEMSNAESAVEPSRAEKLDDGPSQPPRMQGQSQSAAPEGGPRITYAVQRSFLPEDNLEDGLFLDFPSVTSQRPPTLARQPSKTQQESQKSTVDLEDSDEEGGGTRRMRTIHELRAAGRNNRFMQETEGLLEDVAAHATTARSRRRSALIELAQKMMEKEYAERFVGQGFEHRLVPECAAAGDEIADFVLAAVITLMLAAEPPEHTVRALQEGGVVGWLASMLSKGVELGKMAKERKNNMAKSAQSTLVEFGKTLEVQTSLWNDAQLEKMTPRIIALKALDLLVSRIRRLGDRAELLDDTQLEQVLANHAGAHVGGLLDTALSVSVLEALSTAPSAREWPATIMECLGVLLPALNDMAPPPTHTIFLALRLILNLTNDNARNCECFSGAETVEYLLQATKTGFEVLETADAATSEEQRALDYDLLVLALGCMINLAEHSGTARQHAVSATATANLEALLSIFQQAQQRIEDAESLSESTSNVAFGYLAIMLANICQSEEARSFIASKLPGRNLGLLVEAVEEFVRHHQRADAEVGSFEGPEGREVWGAFTERLKRVLGRLRQVAGEA